MTKPPRRSSAPPWKIFISYRRSENAAHAGRLADQLRAYFGAQNIFTDIESIEPGRDFSETTEAAIGSCKILLAVIGRQWLTCTDKHGGRRLDDPKDFVRREIATALGRGVRVIPVLVQGATMPDERELPEVLAPLARRQAWEVTDLRWSHDVGRLIESIARDIPVGRSLVSTAVRRARPLALLTAAAVVFTLAVVYALWTRRIAFRGEPRPDPAREESRPCPKSAGDERRYYEAEAAILSGGAHLDTEHPGFSGYGFVSGYGIVPPEIMALDPGGPSTTFLVEAPSDGQYQVELCYGNGHSDKRSLTIFVNEETVKRTILPNAAEWYFWQTQAETLPLRAGRNAVSYRKRDRGDGDVNLDFIAVAREPNAAPTPTPAPTRRPSSPKPVPTRMPTPKEKRCSPEDILLRRNGCGAEPTSDL